MSELAPLISDLALILICAGVMTLVFKRLKQPLVLGYIVAGFLASPHVPLTPSVIDVANIHTWSEIGVIFLLFALGLEFSFKKLVKVGGTAVIAACTIIFCIRSGKSEGEMQRLAGEGLLFSESIRRSIGSGLTDAAEIRRVYKE